MKGLADADIERVLRELTAIRSDIVAGTARRRLAAVHANFHDSARNLLHYLALRRHDMRPLQLRLAALGLSSLGRAESHVLATVNAVMEVLHRLLQRKWQPPAREAACIDFETGQRLLSEHTEALLGTTTNGRNVRIMVTMPGEAADDYALVHGLLQRGMNCMRINCAHDDAAAWARMIRHLRRAEKVLGRSCRVVMDLAGPKLRTVLLQRGPAVLRIRPRRDIRGQVIAPARVWLSAQPGLPPAPADASLPVPALWLTRLRKADEVYCTDARGARRVFIVAETTPQGCWVEVSRTTYVVPEMLLRHVGKFTSGVGDEARVGDLPASEGVIPLQQGDLLVVLRDIKSAAKTPSSSRAAPVAVIGCTLPEIFEDVQEGESIWFDDGKIGGMVEKMDGDRMHVRITRTKVGGGKLRDGKGINLPDSELRLSALTAKDLEDLKFAVKQADIVELSFANTARDVEQLHRHMARLTRRPPPVVLKIETRRGFANLPEMLLAAMRSPSCGVMIARGDLAVECGFERLAEVQEEILWVCEAAHVPVIWATQVLESLAQKGMPSRAEITDAAMGDRAECVMLNKGPHAVRAVRALDDILRRMQAHQSKKRAMLRELHLAHSLRAARGASRPGF